MTIRRRIRRLLDGGLRGASRRRSVGGLTGVSAGGEGEREQDGGTAWNHHHPPPGVTSACTAA